MARSLKDRKEERESKMKESLEIEKKRSDENLFERATVDDAAEAQAPSPAKKKRGGQVKAIKKDKAVSIRFNGALWADFQKINDYYGIPSTVAINQFVTQYVREKKAELPELFKDNT